MTATAAKTSVLKSLCGISTFVAIISAFLKCQMYWVNLAEIEFLGTEPKFRRREKTSWWYRLRAVSLFLQIQWGECTRSPVLRLQSRAWSFACLRRVAIRIKKTRETARRGGVFTCSCSRKHRKGFSRCSHALMAKKCTKKCAARAELLFCLLNPMRFWRLRCCRRRRC